MVLCALRDCDDTFYTGGWIIAAHIASFSNPVLDSITVVPSLILPNVGKYDAAS